MTVPTTQVYDNAYAPGVSQDIYTPDQLIAGNFQLETQPIILAGGAALLRGTVLGQISQQSVISAAGANTGNGTVGAISRSSGSKQGGYVLTATAPTTFSVTDPEGAVLPAATVGQAYSQQGINFTLTAGATAFVAGDTFTLTAMDATGQYKQSVSTASDGSQIPSAILVDFTDASGGPVAAGAYLTGEFNERAVIFDANSWTLPVLRAALRTVSIFLKASVSAAQPT